MDGALGKNFLTLVNDGADLPASFYKTGRTRDRTRPMLQLAQQQVRNALPAIMKPLRHRLSSDGRGHRLPQTRLLIDERDKLLICRPRDQS